MRLDRVEKQTKKDIIISPFEFNFDESDDTEWGVVSYLIYGGFYERYKCKYNLDI